MPPTNVSRVGGSRFSPKHLHKQRRAPSTRAPFLSIVGRASRRLRGLAVDDFGLLALSVLVAIGMVRGFIASGSSRTRSTCSKPFSRSAPFTTTWSASWNLRSKLRAAMPRCRKVVCSCSVLLLAANGERVLLHLDGEVALAEAGDGHADAILVLADALDIVGRVARSLALEAGRACRATSRAGRSRWWSDKVG